MADEFALIAELFAPLSVGFPGALGLKDDAALLAAQPGFDTVATMDAMVAGVHFLPDDPPDLVARKLVRVNLSDLAAKGAIPFAIMLAAAFPTGVTEDWLRAFAAGLAGDVAEFGVSLIGGDTVSTPGPLTLTITALGRVPAGKAILRSGARAGDDLYVSGTIGDGAFGLDAARGLIASEYLAGRYRLPSPRVTVGPRLIGLASAGMDVSDGLVQDLGHLCRASGIGAVLETARIPLSSEVDNLPETGRIQRVVTGGDDYELLFAAPSSAREALRAVAAETGIPLTLIGRVVEGAGVTVLDAQGQILELRQGGWNHFGASGDGA